LVKEHGWEIKLPGLVTQTRSQASGAAAALDSEREPYSEIAFNEHLVKFIVTNDQVRSRHPFLFSILALTFQPSSLLISWSAPNLDSFYFCCEVI
jgi:hypothetical protein